MNDPKNPNLEWFIKYESDSHDSKVWCVVLPISEMFLTLRIREKGDKFHAELPFGITVWLDAATPEEAQAEAEQYVANVLLEAAARLRQPNSADHVE